MRVGPWSGSVSLCGMTTVEKPVPSVEGVKNRIRAVSAARWLDAFLVFATVVLFTVAWPTLHLTHEVHPSLQPILAALGTFPLLLARANPALGWSMSAGWAALMPFVVGNTPGNAIPWQVVHILALLALLLAVSVRAALPVVGVAWISTILLFVVHLREPGWAVGITAIVAVGMLIRWLVDSRRRLAAQEEVSELERARRAVLEEKARIARDLHDVVAHHMSLVVVQAQSAPYRVPNVSSEARAEFESIGAKAREALNEIRGMLGVLRSDGQLPEHAPQPGAGQLTELLETTLRAGVPLSWKISGDAEVPDTVGLALYRILQESLSNATRHAPGAAVHVEVEYGSAAVALSVVNGPGTAKPVGGTGGHGVAGMQDRAALVGGFVNAGPRADGGFEVLAQLPVFLRTPQSA